MKNLFLTGAFACVASLAASGCGSETNVSVNANGTRAANSNTSSSIANSAINTMSNAANTVSNTVSNLTNSASAGQDTFFTEAAQGGMMEVELGKLTAQKAQNAEVKKFGQMMIMDHTGANNELKALAAKKSVTLPADIGAKHRSTVDSMSKLSGAEFDKEYVSFMVNDHEEDVAKFQKQADSASDPDVKAFALKTLPTLKKHLAEIKAIQGKLK